MSGHLNGGGEDSRVIQFRPRPKPPRAPSRWRHSLKLFLILLLLAATLGGLTTGSWFEWPNLIFAVALAGLITFGEFRAKRR